MFDLCTFYADLWENAHRQFSQKQFEYDPFLDQAHDARRGITLLIKPTGEVVRNIREFLAQAQQLEPEQYYYQPSEIHVTAISIISCYAGFQLDHIKPEQYAELIRHALRDIGVFTIRFTGITASPSCILIQGFPQTDRLAMMRQQLRQAFKASALEHSMDARYEIKTAHSTVIRFRKPLQHPHTFLELLTTYRAHDFGISAVNEVELVLNDWYHRHDLTTTLHQFSL